MENSDSCDVQADGMREWRERLRAWTACGSYNEISRDEQHSSSKTQLGPVLPPRLNCIDTTGVGMLACGGYVCVYVGVHTGMFQI